MIKPKKYGGQQKLVTPDEYVFKFRYIDGLCYMPIEYPLDDDTTLLNHLLPSNDHYPIV
jgi:hypothetical protein